MGAWSLERVSAAFSQAAVDPSRWQDAMDAVAHATGSRGAILVPVHGRIVNPPQSESLAETTEIYFRDGWVHRDERYRGTPAFMRRGVFTDFDFMTADAMARHPYYEEFLAPFGLRWVAGVRVAAGDDLWCLSIQRTIKEGPFSGAQVRQLAALSSKLSSAAAAARALGFARAEAALEAFTASRQAVVLLDRRAEVLAANAAAERLLGGDVRISRRRLVSGKRDATDMLDRQLHRLLWNGTSLAAPVPLPREGRLPLLAYAMRLEGISRDVLAPCQAVVVLVDPDERSRPPEAGLRNLFGLTPAEARLAVRLAAGESLSEAAGALGIAKETARVQLKAVFAKTGVHRQAELVALLAQLRAVSAGEV